MLRFALFFVFVVVTVQLLVAFVSVWIGRFLHPEWELKKQTKGGDKA
jgi:hypothetical protein